MSLVVFTGLAGLVAAPDSIHPLLGFVAVLCIALAAGAAGALNPWWEADTDALMKCTANRPLPSGRMEPGAAIAFGVSVGTGPGLLKGPGVISTSDGALGKGWVRQGRYRWLRDSDKEKK